LSKVYFPNFSKHTVIR